MLRKYATLEILDAQMAQGDTLVRNAHRHVFSYSPRPGYLYVRSRMISSRCNDNFDNFPAAEIESGWRSFIGKPVFVNHHNEDHRKARGMIIDAALHRDTNPDGTPDTWVEGLMEIDALTYPKLAKAIVLGHIERTSMGVDVERSQCSACNNVATTPLEYCRHVPGMKGKSFYRVTAAGEKVSQLIYESCFGLRFFENSLLVEDPADPTAYFLGKPELGPGLDHLASLSTNQPRITTTASRAHFVGEWPPGRPMVGVVDPRMLVDPKPIRQQASMLVQATRCEACRCSETVADRAGHAECFRCGFAWHEGAKAEMLRVEAAKYDKPEDHPFFQAHPVHHQNIVDHWNQATDNEKASGERWYPDAHIIAKALGEYAGKRGVKHPEGTTHLAAGIIANHSPQNGWAGNMHDAARVLEAKKGIGGKGAGMFASDKQRQNDDEMLKGKPYHEVLKGPKINDFAHLIEHGGDKEPENPHVVIDRHALGVAAGHALSDAEYGAAPMSGTRRKDGTLNRRYYDHVVDQYHKAGKVISEKEGHEVPGHAVQAVTWLVRQRLNQKAERERAASGVDSRLDRGREVSRSRAENRWKSWADENEIAHHHAPGTGYQASKVGGQGKGLGDLNVAKPDDLREAMRGVSLGQDEDGFFVYTHRARSDSYARPHDIPASKISYIESTGARLGAVDPFKDFGTHEPSSPTGWKGPKPPAPEHDTELTHRLGPQYHVNQQGHGYYPWPGGVQDAHDDDPGGHIIPTGPRQRVPYPHGPAEDYGSWIDHYDPHDEARDPSIRSMNSRRMAYGETKAPAKVDTLREETCPVCGEQDAWDGNVCSVCNYVAPPKQFQDPDLNKARQLDLRQEQQDYDDSIQPAVDPETGLPMEGDEQPELICPNCGETFEAGEPEATITTDPQEGGLGVGPAEGDVCPNCGKAELVNGDEAAEMGIVPEDTSDDEDGASVDEEDQAGLEPDEDEEDEGKPDVVDPRDLKDVPPQDGEEGDQDESEEDDDADDEDEDDDSKPAKGKPFPPKK